MTGWQTTRENPSSTDHMVWECACGATRDTITAVQRHRQSCPEHQRRLTNHALTEYGGES